MAREIEVPVFDWGGGERRRIGTVSYADDERRVMASQYIGATGRGISLPAAFQLAIHLPTVAVVQRFVVVDGQVTVSGTETAGADSGNAHKLIARHWAGWQIAAIEAVLSQSMFVDSLADAAGRPATGMVSGGSGVLKLGPGKTTNKSAYRRVAENLAESAKVGRPAKRTPEWWQCNVVRPYLDAVEFGSDGYDAVETAARVASSTAKNLVSEARKLGLIPKGQ